MWDSKESVYNIIKPPKLFKQRTPPPTAEELRDRRIARITRKLKLMMRQKSAATMGKPGGHYKPCVTNYLKKHSKEPIIVYGENLHLRIWGHSIQGKCFEVTTGHELFNKEVKLCRLVKEKLSIFNPEEQKLNDVARGAGQQRCTQHQKRLPDLPKDKPVHGRVKLLDYIKSNAEQMIHCKANKSRTPKKQRRYILRRSYGKLPAYLTVRMRESAEKKKKDSPEEKAKAAAECKHAGTRKLEERERISMMNALKMKWADTNARYQQLSVALDLDSQKRQKERFEENLTRLEKDVQLLSRKVILVSGTAPPKVLPNVGTIVH